MNDYQSIIINLMDSEQEEIENILKNYINSSYSKLKDDGTLWILCRFNVKEDETIPTPFIISEKLKNHFLRNILIVPNFKESLKGIIFDNCIINILFFSKSEKYYFNKDAVREKHIWKDIEWGKRKKNYHPLGKDPGNVWLKTEDDGKGNITKHLTLDLHQTVSRLIKVSSIKKENCLLLNFNKEIISDIQNE